MDGSGSGEHVEWTEQELLDGLSLPYGSEGQGFESLQARQQSADAVGTFGISPAANALSIRPDLYTTFATTTPTPARRRDLGANAVDD